MLFRWDWPHSPLQGGSWLDTAMGTNTACQVIGSRETLWSKFARFEESLVLLFSDWKKRNPLACGCEDRNNCGHLTIVRETRLRAQMTDRGERSWEHYRETELEPSPNYVTPCYGFHTWAGNPLYCLNQFELVFLFFLLLAKPSILTDTSHLLS